MMPTLAAANVFEMYEAMAGPCLSSPASARWKTFQLLSFKSAFVAEGVMMARPAASNNGLAAFDSPENAGPTMPRMPASSIAF